MSITVLRLERLYLAHWSEHPLATDMNAFVRGVEAYQRESGLALVLGCVIPADNLGGSTPAQREAVRPLVPRILAACAGGVQLALLGRSVKATLSRSITRGLLMVAGARKTVQVHAELKPAVAAMADAAGVAPQTIWRALEAQQPGAALG